MKIAKKLTDEKFTINFAISNGDEFGHELSEFGMSAGGDKPVVAARNMKDEKFVMSEEFS